MDQMNKICIGSPDQLGDAPIGSMAIDNTSGKIYYKNTDSTVTCYDSIKTNTCDYVSGYSYWDCPSGDVLKKIFGLLGLTIGDEEVEYITTHWND